MKVTNGRKGCARLFGRKWGRNENNKIYGMNKKVELRISTKK